MDYAKYLIWCRYEQSLSVLKHAKLAKEGMITKSSIMLGLGETDEELKEAMADLRAIDVDILTLGQYLQVSANVQAILHHDFWEVRWSNLEHVTRQLGN